MAGEDATVLELVTAARDLVTLVDVDGLDRVRLNTAVDLLILAGERLEVERDRALEDLADEGAS